MHSGSLATNPVRHPTEPLPGDFVIRRRAERHAYFPRPVDVWVVTHWPDADVITAGPYQSFNYAFEQAQRLVRDPSEFIWRDHARPGQREQLELVGGGMV
jgi:hypothetical protein